MGEGGVRAKYLEPARLSLSLEGSLTSTVPVATVCYLVGAATRTAELNFPWGSVSEMFTSA